MKKIIVIGLGNPVLGDDGVGWEVAGLVKSRLEKQGIDVDCLAGGGLAVMERLVGYDEAIIVDTINSGDVPFANVRSFKLTDLVDPFSGHLGSAHETNLRTALELGRSLGAHLPTEVLVVAIESPYVFDFSEELSPGIKAALPAAVEAVLAAVNQVSID